MSGREATVCPLRLLASFSFFLLEICWFISGFGVFPLGFFALVLVSRFWFLPMILEMLDAIEQSRPPKSLYGGQGSSLVGLR